MRTSWRSLFATLLATGAALAALLPVGATAVSLVAMPSEAGDPAPISHRYIVQLQADEAAIAATRSDQAALGAHKPGGDPIANSVLKLEQDDAAYHFRQAIRAQQADLLRVAADDGVSQAVIKDAPPALSVIVSDTVGAWRALWHLAGIDEFNLVRIHPRPLDGAAPTAVLAQFYKDSAGHYQLDWTYLAAINFIESDFGRVNGPSSAGAVGPMQFMPSTWAAYGDGDVNNPKDAINGAARYLFVSGARRNMDGALFAYNHDSDYVAAVDDYADAIRHDPAWLERFYYWNTIG
jgi:membrane-bound lytic murein transglycosylase B